jgi:hypothetical protein
MRGFQFVTHETPFIGPLGARIEDVVGYRRFIYENGVAVVDTDPTMFSFRMLVRAIPDEPADGYLASVGIGACDLPVVDSTLESVNLGESQLLATMRSIREADGEDFTGKPTVGSSGVWAPSTWTDLRDGASALLGWNRVYNYATGSPSGSVPPVTLPPKDPTLDVEHGGTLEVAGPTPPAPMVPVPGTTVLVANDAPALSTDLQKVIAFIYGLGA